jgi:hypothetical protein
MVEFRQFFGSHEQHDVPAIHANTREGRAKEQITFVRMKQPLQDALRWL